MAETEAGAVASVAQLQGMWGALVEDRGSGDICDGEISVRWADTAFSFYNCLTFSQPGTDRAGLERKLALAAGYMRGKRNAGFLWLFEDLLAPRAVETLGDATVRAGLVRAMPCWGMAGEVLPLPAPRHPALRFERVATEDHLSAYAGLNARAYGLPSEDAREALRGSSLFRRAHAYIAYEGDRPVSCASAHPVDGCLFVALVATDPADHRRGFGEAVTRKALHEAGRATGLRRATLHATAAGRPVYERIGLRSTARMSLYVLAPSA